MQISPNPDTARDAIEHVRRIELPAIFNHSMRTFILARAAAATTGEEIDLEALCVACLFHDSGASDENDGPQRFEVEGADAAVRFLRHRGWSREREDAVWEAIALHTSPGIAERRGPITRYTRLGVRIDFGVADVLTREFVEATEREYARLDIERVLSFIVVQQSLSRPEKAPMGSWPGALRAAYLADPRQRGIESGVVNRAASDCAECADQWCADHVASWPGTVLNCACDVRPIAITYIDRRGGS